MSNGLFFDSNVRELRKVLNNDFYFYSKNKNLKYKDSSF